MRCPKCGYTSFDNQDRCKKCKKRLSSAATLMGTVINATPPSFLFTAKPQQETDDFAEDEDVVVDLGMGEDHVLDLSAPEEPLVPPGDAGGKGVQLSDLFRSGKDSPDQGLGLDAPAALADDESMDLRLDEDGDDEEGPSPGSGLDFPAALADVPDMTDDGPGAVQPPVSPVTGGGETGTLQELDLDFELDLPLDDGDEAAAALEAPASAAVAASRIGLDLAKVDISDLQAPQEPTDAERAEEEAEGGEETPASVLAAYAEELGDFEDEPDTGAQEEFSLEDLQVEGLGMEKSAMPAPGAGYQPATKTGTALDSFHFELQELLEVNDNEKA